MMGFRFVDAHMHMWDLDLIKYPWLSPPFVEGPAGVTESIAHNYGLKDYQAESAKWNVRAIVHVEAGAAAGDALRETEWLQASSDVTGLPQAIVAFAALNDPRIESLLEAQAAHKNVRGIRHIVGWHPNPRISYSARDLTGDPQWQAGFSLLRKFDLSFDLQAYPSQFLNLAELIARHPETVVVLNHLGMPVLDDEDGQKLWITGTKELASLPNVFIKLSGVGFIHRSWTIEAIRPWLLRAIEFFGPQRCLLASDFPTDRLFGDFDTHLNAYMRILSEFSEDERDDICAGNAARVYRIEL